MEVLTVCPRDFPGVTSQFKHLAATTGLTEHSLEVSKKTLEGKKLVIFGAWSHYYYRALKQLRSEEVKVGLLWTSPVGQMGFSPNFVDTCSSSKIYCEAECWICCSCRRSG